MPHFRQTIREELEARATAVVSAAGAPGDSRESSVDQADLPSSIVTFSIEEVTDRLVQTEDLCRTRRQLSASVAFMATSPDQVEEMAAEFENRMVSKIAPGVLHRHTETRFEDPARAERDFFSLSLEYEIEYALLDGTPDEAA